MKYDIRFFQLTARKSAGSFENCNHVNRKWTMPCFACSKETHYKI